MFRSILFSSVSALACLCLPLYSAAQTERKGAAHACGTRRGPMHGTHGEVRPSPISLYRAIRAGDVAALEALIAGGVNVNDMPGGLRPPQLAAHLGDTEAVTLRLGAGADVQAAGGDGATALMGAAYSGCLPTLRALLKAGARVNAAAAHGETALMSAAKKGHVDLLRALIAAGADVNHRTDAGETALSYATKMKRAEIAAQLRDAGAAK